MCFYYYYYYIRVLMLLACAGSTTSIICVLILLDCYQVYGPALVQLCCSSVVAAQAVCLLLTNQSCSAATELQHSSA